jgi:YbbR domain-containing protein
MTSARVRRDTVGAFRPAVRPEPEPSQRRSPGAWLRGAFTEHLGLKLLALLLTLTVLLLVGASDEEREISVRVPVTYILPEGKELVSERIDEVRVQIKGPWRRIKRFDERELAEINLDVSKMRGGEVAINPQLVRVPDGLKVIDIAPRSVRVAFEDTIEKEVEVLPVVTGRPAHGYAVVAGATRTNPVKVVVRGPRGVVSAMSQVRTQDIAVDGRSRALVVEVTLLPPEGVSVDWKGTVEVDVTIAGRWVGTAPVAIAGEGGMAVGGLATEPREVEVELTGAKDAIDRLVEAGVRPTVRAARNAYAAAGASAQVAVDGVPSGVQVVVRPAEVRVGPKR